MPRFGRKHGFNEMEPPVTQPAICQTALDTFSVTRHAIDPRADGGCRIVHVNATQVVIERTLQSVRMKVAVPVANYRGLVLSVRTQSATASVLLRHEDEDLDVVLASGEAIAAAKSAKAWGAVLGLQVSLEEATITIRRPFERSGRGMRPDRRSSFSGRRKTGILARLERSFAHEREIIAGD